MNHLFIINPAAGKGKTLKFIPLIEKIFQHRNEKYIIEVTKGVGHASELVRKYCSEEDYRVYSVGGDGTLNEVLNGIVNTNSSLAVIPCGSGNDFIKSIYNYSKREKIEDIFLKMIDGKDKYIDLGKVNNRYFINIASVGFDAEVAYNAIKLKKLPFIGGTLAYILGIIITVFKYKSPDLKINIDNRQFNMKALLVAVANGRYYGGGINVTPKAEIDDGIFNICNIEEVSKPKILILFPKVIKGTHSKIKEVHFTNGKNIKLTSPNEISFNIDGEISRGKEVEFIMIPNGIKIVFP
ncbi:lipid kinase, YegS/Rv2252/BmrU family [Clostridiales bacterium oral taxon 876 str. F0540]|nr:lipid kinase, YegS/Rv2252/BmrU family [Clostridiales bacterium oral taxon 876 str. F0540]